MFTVCDFAFGANKLRNVMSAEFMPQQNVVRGRQSGDVTTQALHVTQLAPMIQIQTGDLAGLLDGSGMFGGTSYMHLSNSAAIMYLREKSLGGTFASGSSHTTIAGSYSLSTIQGISAQQDGDFAQGTVQTQFYSPDGTAPMTLSASQALVTMAYQPQFGFGAVTIGGTRLTDVTAWNVNTGLSVEAYRVEGNAYPTKIFILESNPSIDLTFKHAPSIASLAFFSSATLIVYAYKRTDGGIYSGSSDHISITSSGPLIAMERIGGQGTQPGDVTYRCHCKALTYSIAADIPS